MVVSYILSRVVIIMKEISKKTIAAASRSYLSYNRDLDFRAVISNTI